MPNIADTATNSDILNLGFSCRTTLLHDMLKVVTVKG